MAIISEAQADDSLDNFPAQSISHMDNDNIENHLHYGSIRSHLEWKESQVEKRFVDTQVPGQAIQRIRQKGKEDKGIEWVYRCKSGTVDGLI